MAPTIQLLHPTAPGNTWIRVVLDVEPEDFSLDHVRDLRRALLGLSGSRGVVRVISIARWMPILELEMPASRRGSRVGAR